MNEEERAARLLRGENAPSVIEREEMAENILERVGAERSKRTWLRLGLSAVAATSAVAVLLFALPGELTPRGGNVGAALEAACEPGPACRQGGRLLLRVSNYEPQDGYLAAFARRGDGTVIWYFPKDDSSDALQVRAGEWAARAVVLGEEHTPGDYELYAVLSATPIDRDAARMLVERGGDDEHVVLTIELEVVP